jgi:hypothetical protein
MKERLGASLVLARTTDICWAAYMVFLSKEKFVKTEAMDQSPINQNFELNKSRQKFHHILKEHHKISSIPKFRFKMM